VSLIYAARRFSIEFAGHGSPRFESLYGMGYQKEEIDQDQQHERAGRHSQEVLATCNGICASIR
jgi:hypothetical protein